jgi:hypothetical protein
MSIYHQLEAKTKAFDIIESSTCTAHIDAAKKYIKLYYIKFEDELGYLYLKRILENKLTLINKKEKLNGKK